MRTKLQIPVLFLLLMLLLLASGCAPSSWKRSQQAYRAGDTVRAVELSIQTLREKHGYKKAVSFLKMNLENAFNYAYDRAQYAEEIGDWDAAYDWYRTIDRISGQIALLSAQPDPNTKRDIRFEGRDVRTELRNATQEAAEMHYRAGMRLEREGRDREAARAYNTALQYVPNYRDASRRYEVTRAAAVERVAVMGFENVSGKREFGAVGEILSTQIISNLMTDRRNVEFLELLTRDQIAQLIAEQKLGRVVHVDESSAAEIGKLIGIHSFVFGKVLSINLQYYPDAREVTQEEAEVSEGRDQPKRMVTATVTTTTRRATARVISSYQVVDVSRGTIVRSGTVPHDLEVVIQFARFRGDERALSSKSRNLVNRPEEVPPPPDELVFVTLEKLSATIARELTVFLNQ
jgi:tetratricopeptide (TPR) repeat protein